MKVHFNMAFFLLLRTVTFVEAKDLSRILAMGTYV